MDPSFNARLTRFVDALEPTDTHGSCPVTAGQHEQATEESLVQLTRHGDGKSGVLDLHLCRACQCLYYTWSR